MDIQMPVMDGLEATKAIHNLQSAVRIPIIAMTAHATKADREKAFEAGMDDYITKPLRRTKLLATVEKWSKMISDSGLLIADLRSKIENPKSKIQSAPMNFEKAIEEFEGDKEFLIEVLKGFLDNVRTQIETIHQAISNGEAISNGDAEVVWKEAHSIKGGAANLTADKLSEIAFELEKAGKLGMLEEGGGIFERLKKEFYRLENFAKGIDECN
jgi:HPt (histidine-containing phosphotransfer) domain-containing protein